MEQTKLNIEEEMNVLREVKSHIKGDPLCHRSNCHGTGVVGITTTKVNGMLKPQLLVCSCAKFGETEYKVLTDKVGGLKLELNQDFLILSQEITKLKRATLIGQIFYQIEKLKSKKQAKKSHGTEKT